MHALKSRWLWIASTCYLLAFGLLVSGRWSELIRLDLNELGDLLAGIFSPLAFLWLVGGYMQQGEELRLNTEALQLQANELKNSVEQQAEMVHVAREQLEAERDRFLLQTMPRFGVTVIERSQPYGTSFPAFKIGLINHGARAVRVLANLKIKDEFYSYEKESMEPLELWSIPLQVLDKFQGHTSTLLVHISCQAATGTLNPSEFSLKLSQETDGSWTLSA